MTGGPSESVGAAVPEVQPCRVPSLPETLPSMPCVANVFGCEGGDLER